MAKGSTAGTSGKDDGALASAYLARIDDLVGIACLDNAVLVNARGMRKGVCADDCLVRLNDEARDGGNQTGSAHEFTGVDVGMGVKLLAVHLDAHDNFFHSGVASALAQAVDGAFDLTSAVFDTSERKGGSHAKVVVAVNGKRCLVHVGNVFHQELDATAEFVRQRVAGGVGDVDYRSASGNCCLYNLCQELVVGTTCVLCVELNVFDVLLGVLNGVDRALDDLFGRGAQLFVDVAVGNADARVDTGALALGQSASSGIDVLFNGTGQGAYDGAVPYLSGDLLNRLEVTRGRHRKARLDNIDIQAQ